MSFCPFVLSSLKFGTANSFRAVSDRVYNIQWYPSNWDTIGTEESVRISEVS